jgi:hypothetical protein
MSQASPFFVTLLIEPEKMPGLSENWSVWVIQKTGFSAVAALSKRRPMIRRLSSARSSCSSLRLPSSAIAQL